jgi:putative hemolysin
MRKFKPADIIHALAIMGAITFIVLFAASCAAPARAEDAEGAYIVVDVAQASLYCLARGKILAVAAVDAEGNFVGGVCAYPPGIGEDGEPEAPAQRGGNS